MTGMETADLIAMNTDQFKVLSSAQIGAMTTDQLAAFETADLASVSTAALRGFGSDDLAALGTDQIVALTTAQVQSLTTQQLVGLTTEQVHAFETADIVAMSTQQLRGFTTEQFSSFGTEHLTSMSSAQLNSLLSEQVHAIGTDSIVAFDSSDFAALSTQAIHGFATDQIAAFASEDFKALSSAQVVAMSTEQLHAITSDQVVGLDASDLGKLSMSQAAAFATEAIHAMHSDQLNALIPAQVSPIVLDLDGNGVTTTSAHEGVSYDLLGTGVWQQWGWVGGNDGLLVHDLNGNGQIENGKELFGEGTVLPDGTRAKDGFAAMAALDSNHDGKLDANDKDFSQLQVWVDKNHDGISEAGELKGLAGLGITSISLHSAGSTATDHGNLLGLVGSFQTSDGANHQMADVWFSRDASAGSSTTGPVQHAATPPATDHAEADTHLKLSDVLTAPSDLHLPGAAVAGTAASLTVSATADPLLAMRPKSPDEDELHRQPPLI